MTIETIALNGAPELFRKLNDLMQQGRLVYRGHRNAEWKLSSTLSRHRRAPYDVQASHLLDRMLNNFLVYARGIGLEPPFEQENDKRHGRLEFGRHYGIPSPLIDFSYSPYIAAFFAFSGVRPTEANREDQAAIYCLNLHQIAGLWARLVTQNHDGKIDGTRFTEEHNRFMYDIGPLFGDGYPARKLKFIPSPASWNRRMRRQLGCFLYDSLDYTQFGLQDLEHFMDQKEVPELGQDGVPQQQPPTLRKIMVPHQAGRGVLEHLDLMGFSATYLYDSYEGAAIDVIDDYNFSRTSGQVWDVRPPSVGDG
jgi:hypothetical protein